MPFRFTYNAEDGPLLLGVILVVLFTGCYRAMIRSGTFQKLHENRNDPEQGTLLH